MNRYKKVKEDYYNYMKIELFNDDCLKKMKSIKDRSIDLILTDPPYNLGNFMRNRQTNLKKMRKNFFGDAGWDDLEYEVWISKFRSFFEESSRIIKSGGSLVIFMAIIKVESIINIAEDFGFYYKTTGIWHKLNPMPRNMNLHFVNSTETWIYFTYKEKTGKFNNDGKLLHDFIETPITQKKEKKFGNHPTQKPISLMEFFINILSDENDTILDPFMGSGTVGVASKKLNRKFIGIEKSKKYYLISKKRIVGVNDNDNKCN